MLSPVRRSAYGYRLAQALRVCRVWSRLALLMQTLLDAVLFELAPQTGAADGKSLRGA